DKTRHMPDPGKPRLSPGKLLRLIPAPGEIVLITGPSGAGKSSLLRALRGASVSNVSKRGAKLAWIDLDQIAPPDLPLVDCFGDEPPESVLSRLGKVGLGEAWTYLRTPAELSE